MYVLYSTVSNPLDRWKRFTPVHPDTNSTHGAITRGDYVFTHISTAVYSHVSLIYTAELIQEPWREQYAQTSKQ